MISASRTQGINITVLEMASYPLQNYVGKDIPLWLPNDGSISVSTIVASTITTDEIAVIPSSNMAFGVIGIQNTSTLATTSLVDAGYAALTQYVVQNANNSTLMTAATGITNANGSYTSVYITNDLAGNATTRGQIAIVSSIQGQQGGVELTGQDNSILNVGNNGANLALSNAGLNFFFNPPNNAQINHKIANEQNGQISFTGGAGNQSSITLLAGGANQAAVYVGDNGVTLMPGSNQAVTLQAGSINVNNLAMSNVSSINGAYVNTQVYIDPYGASPIFSTIGNTNTTIPMLYFSTIAYHNYQVMVEYSAGNGGGGGANDTTSIGITNYNSNVGLFGRFIAVDSWVTDDTYDGRRANVCAVFPANSNSTGAAALEVLNVTAGGNVQIVTLEQVVVKDLGLPQNLF